MIFFFSNYDVVVSQPSAWQPKNQSQLLHEALASMESSRYTLGRFVADDHFCNHAGILKLHVGTSPGEDQPYQ